MDETMNSGAITTESADSEFEDWSDIDVSGLTDDEEGGEEATAPETGEEAPAQADQPESGETDTEPGEEKAEDRGEDGKSAESEGSDQTFELKHLDETRTVGRDEVIALAQKGLDYDRIRGKLDELRGLEAQASENSAYAEFVQELANNAGVTPDVLMDSTRAKILMGKTAGLSQDDALKQAKAAREARAQSEQQSREAREARGKQEHFREEVMRFSRLHPDVKAEDITAEVWADFDRGGNLTDAWQNAENRRLSAENQRLQKELETLKQDKKNTERSTGSRKTAGAGSHSAVDDAWEEALKSW